MQNQHLESTSDTESTLFGMKWVTGLVMKPLVSQISDFFLASFNFY